MEGLVGQAFGRYQLETLLGEGGMGAVYRARDVTLQRDVAIKVMHPQFARRPHFRERFLQEARTAARLDHPGIVDMYDFGQQESHLYIVMEFIPGDNLRSMLHRLREKGKWVALPEAVEMVRQISLAIDYAHRHGVLHRDIKPDNVMLKPEASDPLPYSPILTDLGLAKLADGGVMTQEGVSIGTPAYMSPEQALGQETDSRSDVYSLGVLLYEMAVGQLPFPARTITEAIRYHTQEPPPPPRTLKPDLPAELERTILRAMAKDPADRFADAAAFAGALGGSVQGSVAAMPTAEPTAMGEAVSLMTEYGQGAPQARGQSLFAEFKTPPPEITGDSVQVLMADGSVKSVALKAGGLTIGRGADSGLVLEGNRVSRRHARIDSDGATYRVTDLDSTNGTYLQDVRLLPGVPEIWTPDKPLHIGEFWLRLVRAPQAASRVASRAAGVPEGTMVGGSRLGSSRAGSGRAGVFMEAQQLSVGPGEAVTVALVVLNQGSQVDHFRTSVEGIPEAWLPEPPEPIRLMPGEQGEVDLIIKPPRTSQSRAGRYPLIIRVTSQDAPSDGAEIRRNLTVGAFSRFSSTMQPQQVKAGTPVRVSVRNEGNTPETYTLSLQDRADELSFEPPEVRLNVAEGQMAAAEVRAAPKQRKWIGGVSRHAFSAQVATASGAAGGGAAQSHSGEILSRALIPIWVIPVALLLLIAIGVGASSLDTDGDTLSLAQELRLGSSPSNADSDDDGLTDKQEVDLRTDPRNPDSDGDGLLDGREIAYGANPLAVDSDGDTLPDGREVDQMGTSPTNLDTDGDGRPDNVDAAPLQEPTPAPVPTATATLTPTPDLSGTDEDGDGLTLAEEQALGTNPRNPDTDGDGLPDGEERRWGSNPLIIDSDGDTLTDGREVNELSTSPTNPDTDGDGQPDNVDPAPGSPPTPEPTADLSGTDEDGDGLTLAQEQALGTNPANADSDGDGLADGQEQGWGTDPRRADSDGDGLSDGQEVTETGTSPTNADTDGDGTPDAADPDPLHGPTPTATATNLPTLVPSRTPTEAVGAKMEDFLGTWVNTDSDGSPTKVILSKVNNTVVSVNGFGKCSPSDCDWGAVNTTFTPGKIKVSQDQGFKVVTMTFVRDGDKLDAVLVHDYKPGDPRTDYTVQVTLRRQLIIAPIGPIKIITPMIILPKQ